MPPVQSRCSGDLRCPRVQRFGAVDVKPHITRRPRAGSRLFALLPGWRWAVVLIVWFFPCGGGRPRVLGQDIMMTTRAATRLARGFRSLAAGSCRLWRSTDTRRIQLAGDSLQNRQNSKQHWLPSVSGPPRSGHNFGPGSIGHTTRLAGALACGVRQKCKSAKRLCWLSLHTPTHPPARAGRTPFRALAGLAPYHSATMACTHAGRRV